MIEASCHCGAVRLEVAAAPETVTDCNCSICRRLGALWAYYPPEQVRFLSPREATFFYSWGDHDLEFHHCKVCGCTTHWEAVEKPGQKIGINSRLMAPEFRTAARIRKFDGADSWTELE